MGSEHVQSLASHGVALSHTVTKLEHSCSWISDASWELSYHTERSRRIDQRQTGHDISFKFTGKELDSETGYTYFGARYYDSGLSVWFARPPKLHSLHKKVYAAVKHKWVDSLADKYLSTSPYAYVENNPIMFIDPNGMLKDWFHNEKTGDVYYNSDMHKGDEGTGDMKGEGWQHMGENGMFDDGENGQDDLTVLTSQGVTPNYTPDSDGSGRQIISAYLKGDRAKSFMKSQGYDFNPTQQVVYKYSPVVKISGAPRQPKLEIRITEKSRYMKDYYETGRGYISPIKMKNSALEFSSVGRMSISYSNKSSIASIFLRIFSIFYPTSPIVFVDWSNYNNVDIINTFRRKYEKK